jgi:hypothetical protein
VQQEEDMMHSPAQDYGSNENSGREPAAPRLPKRPERIFIRALAVLLTLMAMFAFFGSLFLWGRGFILTFPPGTDYAFPVADILVHTPAALIAAFGLWRLRFYGYAAFLFVAGFYVYASVEIFVHVIQAGPPYPAAILGPQVFAVAVAAVPVACLRRMRRVLR